MDDEDCFPSAVYVTTAAPAIIAVSTSVHPVSVRLTAYVKPSHPRQHLVQPQWNSRVNTTIPSHSDLSSSALLEPYTPPTPNITSDVAARVAVPTSRNGMYTVGGGADVQAGHTVHSDQNRRRTHPSQWSIARAPSKRCGVVELLPPFQPY